MTNYSFFIDIDGTLVCSRQMLLTDTMKKIAKKAREQGAKFFINTARSRALVPETLADPEVFDGVCTGGGTHIELNGKCVYSRYISHEVLMEIASAYLRLGETFTLIFEGSEKMLFVGKRYDWFGKNFVQIDGMHDLQTKFKNAKIQKFSSTGSVRPSKAFLEEMSVRFDMIDHTRYVEGMEYGFDKGGAIKIAERELNIPHESTVAIGDSKNDIPMLKYAQISIAMGNASDDIKAMCSFVTDTVDNDGVSKAITKLCLEGELWK